MVELKSCLLEVSASGTPIHLSPVRTPNCLTTRRAPTANSAEPAPRKQRPRYANARFRRGRNTGPLAAADRAANECDVVQVESPKTSLQIFGESVIGVARHRLVATTETASIAGDHAIASLLKRRHLRFPRLAGERPTRNEHGRPAGAAGVVDIQIDVLDKTCWTVISVMEAPPNIATCLVSLVRSQPAR